MPQLAEHLDPDVRAALLAITDAVSTPRVAPADSVSVASAPADGAATAPGPGAPRTYGLTQRGTRLLTAAATPWLQLHHALLALSDDGRATPCQTDPTAWYAEAPDDRALAARACRPCPVRLLCSDYADASREDEGVWGAQDRTRRRHQDYVDGHVNPDQRSTPYPHTA